jgi:hypothetical protein
MPTSGSSSAVPATTPTGLLTLRVGKIPDTQFPNPNYPNPDPKYLNPKYPITISDTDHKNPKLVWIIRVMFPGTELPKLPEISQIFALLFLRRHEVFQCHINIIWYELM